MKIPNPFFLILFFLLSQFSLFSADDGNFNPNPNCHPFDCGSLGKVGYPFSNITNPECGLYVIFNCTEPTPVIDFKLGGKLYDVKNVFNNNRTIVVHDKFLQKGLLSKDCGFLNNFSLPVSNHVSFEFKNPTLTLFKCSKSIYASLQAHFTNFQLYEGCKDYVLFYGYQQLLSVPLPDRNPPLCSVIELPLSQLPQEDFLGLFPPLSADFSLEWNLSSSTSLYTSNEETDGEKRRKKKVAIGISAGVGGFCLACLCTFLFNYLRHRKNRHSISSNLVSQNISPDSSLKYPENGSYFATPIFSYQELEVATNNFDSKRELGDGGFGIVYHGELRGRIVAVKRLYKNNFERVEQFMNEVNILSLLRHENLVTLYGCTSRHSRELLLVYEYVPNGTVADHIHGELARAGLATWPIRMNIAIESAVALKYLHASEIIHRDVKTNNILLDKNFHVKVADFGISRLFPIDVTHVSTAPQGTPGYIDPEYYQCYQLTYKSDVYSFGVVLIELISSKPAVDISRHRHDINLSNLAINKIQNHSLSELVDPCLGFETDNQARRMITLVAKLAFRCLQQDRDMRPSMAEVLEVLKGIAGEEDNVVKAEEVIDIPADHDVVRLLKNDTAPFSPISGTETG